MSTLSTERKIKDLESLILHVREKFPILTICHTTELARRYRFTTNIFKVLQKYNLVLVCRAGDCGFAGKDIRGNTSVIKYKGDGSNPTKKVLRKVYDDYKTFGTLEKRTVHVETVEVVTPTFSQNVVKMDINVDKTVSFTSKQLVFIKELMTNNGQPTKLSLNNLLVLNDIVLIQFKQNSNEDFKIDFINKNVEIASTLIIKEFRLSIRESSEGIIYLDLRR